MIDLHPNEIEVTIPGWKANLLSIITFLLSFAVYGVPFIFMWTFGVYYKALNIFLTDYVILIITLLVGAVMHELLHAVTFASFCKNGFKSISFGFKWQHLAPYVHCAEDLTLDQYRLGTIIPGIVLGILPAIAAVLLGSGWLLWFGTFFTAGAAADVWSFAKLNPYSSNHYRVRDHPEETGFILIRKFDDPTYAEDGSGRRL